MLILVLKLVACQEVFRLVDTKFAGSAKLNLCLLKLRPHYICIYDSIFARLNLSCTCAKITNLFSSNMISVYVALLHSLYKYLCHYA